MLDVGGAVFSHPAVETAGFKMIDVVSALIGSETCVTAKIVKDP
ncbi:MAG: hypothetical protein U5L45_15075 [Saprospiraceae bacterium]|nr:hypothetical protein [Saprospiraceae bacterium]